MSSRRMVGECSNAVPLVSIIVPVYNTPQALFERCMTSILAQDYGNIEILLADDGSESWCAALCDEQARRSTKVKVLHLPHGGVSHVRNAAMEAALGDWIAFVDADDEVSPGFVKEAVALAISYDVDCVIGDRQVFDDGAFKKETRYQGAETTEVALVIGANQVEEYCVQLLSNLMLVDSEVPRSLPAAAHAKLYKRDYCQYVKFDCEMAHLEDVLFNVQYLLRCNRIVQVSGAFWYAYFHRADSSSRTTILDRCLEEQRHLHALDFGERLIKARVALECRYSFTVVEEILKTNGGFFRARHALQEMDRTGSCFKQLSFKGFDVSLGRRIVWLAAKYRLYSFAVFLSVLKCVLDEKKNGRELSGVEKEK